MNHRGVADIRLLETHRKATKVLELAKEILHQMTPLIHLRVVLDLIDAIRPGRNHYRSATGLQLGAQLVAVVGFVGNQGLELDAIKSREQRQSNHDAGPAAAQIPPSCQARRPSR